MKYIVLILVMITVTNGFGQIGDGKAVEKSKIIGAASRSGG